MLALRLLISALIVVSSATPLIGAPDAAGNFRAAVATVDITPSAGKWLAGYPARKSTGIHDHIFHRIVALDDGRTQFFLISSDLCLFAPSVYDEMTAQLKRETGIEPIQIWWVVTHTHLKGKENRSGLASIRRWLCYSLDWDPCSVETITL